MTDVRKTLVATLIEHLGLTEAELAADGAHQLPIFIGQEQVKANISKGAPQPASLGGDSLDWVELVMAVEEIFSIEVPDEDAEDPKLNSIDGLVAYIEGKRGQ